MKISDKEKKRLEQARIANAKLRAKKREAGLRQLTIWVRPEEAKKIKASINYGLENNLDFIACAFSKLKNDQIIKNYKNALFSIVDEGEDGQVMFQVYPCS